MVKSSGKKSFQPVSLFGKLMENFKKRENTNSDDDFLHNNNNNINLEELIIRG